MKISQLSVISIILVILVMPILSGCVYRPDQRSVYPTNTPYQNTQYQERNYPLRLISEKVDLDIGYKWNVGSGYVLVIQAIDAKATPKQIWLSLFKDGKQVDDKVLSEGETYNYQNMFKTTASRIYIGENTDRVVLTNTNIYP